VGGSGSGRWRGSQSVVEEFQCIDLAHLDRWAGKMRIVLDETAMSATFTYVVARKQFVQRVPLQFTRTMFDGRRRWFTCPGCRRGCRVLYIVPQLRCRKCCTLLYASQRASRDQSRLWRLDALRERIGLRLGQQFELGMEFPPRPKRMRRTTYRRLEAKYDEAQARWLAGIAGFIRRLGRRLG
jgi:hypothetical protein